MKSRIISIALSLIIILTFSAGAQCQQTLTTEQKRQAIAELAKALRARYAIGDIAETIARAVEKRLESGAYDALNNPISFGDAVTRDLQAASNDLHLRFGMAPPSPPPSSSPLPDPEAERIAHMKGLRETNFGFVKAEILPGNVGYLRINRFQAPDVAVDTLNGTMAFLANTDAIIIDLRYCPGGNAHMMPWFAGYFFSQPTSLFNMVFRGDNVTERYWTQPWLPGKRLDHQPMYILTSAHTFSGAEGFAYRFKVLKRATIIGEKTRGGANAGGVLKIPPLFAVWMPMGRPVDPDTGTNWEGTGVMPDIKSSAREALAVAHLDALGKLKARAGDTKDLARFEWAIEQAEASRLPFALDEDALSRFEGSYGPDHVWIEGGQLRYQRETRPIVLLTPVTETVFAAEAYNPVRIGFILGTSGPATAIVVTDGTWTCQEIPRNR